MEELLTAGMAALDGEALPGRDLFIVAQYLVPTEAHLAQGCLVAAGIPAVVCGPGSMDQGHKPDEFIEESQMNAGERFLQSLLGSLKQ